MAGVSTATVSRVINQTAWVEPVTRERVEKAMRDLNYRRNAAAIALAKRSGDMLGLLTGNLADPFFARLARGVEDVSRKQQYRLMVCSGGHDEEMEKAGLDFLGLIKAVRLLLYTPADYRIKSCCATQPTFQRWLLLIVISPVWPTGVSGWKIAAPPGKRPDISWRTGIGASPV